MVNPKVIKYTSRTASLQGVICDRNIHATKPFGFATFQVLEERQVYYIRVVMFD
ncbi:MAG: hypothetical protein MK289_22935 [Trichodesmium sp. ALOHA_ZT_67]|uniref:hypothetical protein n=1 Tax=Trichodesmium erythraeum TaxID=1206 RepID=UPI00003C9B10|nr:hypothetical protein [Trichodesmium erythraeum GBRTRLIN201]MCH2051201.1 hypothetical protein [Trichodesmium sp. ALOHA_ZT_67]